KPDEFRGEMCPGWIDAFPLLEVREIPAIGDLVAVVRHGSTSLRKAGMREHEHCHPVRFQDTVECMQSSLQVRGIHQPIIRVHQVKGRISECAKGSAGIHAEVYSGMVGTGDLDHSFREVNPCHPSTSVLEFLGQIPCATACVEHRAPLDVTCQCPEHRV